jgi:Cyclin M transmembrane N-terminal domain
MKTSLTLLAALVSIVATQVSAAPQVGNATLNPAAAQAHHIENLHKYGGPKANPGKFKQHAGVQAGNAAGAAGAAAMGDDYCGNGIKPIPGVNPVGNSLRRGGLAMNDIEPCGTPVPGRIPGGVGPVGPR